MTASLVITTKNRCHELRRALNSARKQSVPLEIIVIDDASTDETSELVRREFPEVRLERSTISRGCVVQRNQGARLAHGSVIFSLDDDAEFSDPRIVEETLRDLAADASIGAVAIPYVEPHKANIILQTGPDSQSIWITDTYIGTAHAVRRDLFLKLGGYWEHLVHQGEEGDFCLRMLAAGYRVRLGTSAPIIHHESPKRDLSRMDYYGARNSVLFGWHHAPWPALPIHLLGTTWSCLTWTMRPDRLKTRTRALMDAWKSLPSVPREPVPFQTYRLFRQLRKEGPIVMGTEA